MRLRSTSDQRSATGDQQMIPGRGSLVARLSFSLTLRFLRSLFLVAASVAVIAQLAVLRSVLIGRAPASTPGRGARFAEIAWVVLPTIALIVVFLVTWRVLGEPVAVAPVNYGAAGMANGAVMKVAK